MGVRFLGYVGREDVAEVAIVVVDIVGLGRAPAVHDAASAEIGECGLGDTVLIDRLLHRERATGIVAAVHQVHAGAEFVAAAGVCVAVVDEMPDSRTVVASVPQLPGHVCG